MKFMRRQASYTEENEGEQCCDAGGELVNWVLEVSRGMLGGRKLGAMARATKVHPAHSTSEFGLLSYR